MLLSLIQQSQPAAEPVSLSIAKQQCRIDFPDDDLLVSGLITAARIYAEKYMQLAIFDRSMMRTMDYFPIWTGGNTVNPAARSSWMYYSQYWNAVRIDLPGRISSVTSITYLDPNSGNTLTLDPSNYIVDTTSIPGRIVPAQGMTWPVQELYAPGSVRITYVAGSFGDGVEVNNCPQTIVQAILMLVDHWYNHRSAVSEGSMSNVPLAVPCLLDCHKMETFNIQ